ncbi:MAG: hypothetical protein NT045_07365, partial [Candidatus Aureabacteria bacterium]|nr:hypothetical protein [Candidatus Auribacterota bacterium]
MPAQRADRKNRAVSSWLLSPTLPTSTVVSPSLRMIRSTGDVSPNGWMPRAAAGCRKIAFMPGRGKG